MFTHVISFSLLMHNFSCECQHFVSLLVSLHSGILEVLYCVLIESPEVLNIIQENHIKSIISLLDKHGRNHKVCPPSLAGEGREGTSTGSKSIPSIWLVC